MTSKLVALIALLIAFLGGDANAVDTRAQYSSIRYLKNFALSVCISHAYQAPELTKDALAAAGGYLELGSMPFEAYEAADQLSKTFLARSYRNSSGSQLVIMKCIDLFSSKELDALARKYAIK